MCGGDRCGRRNDQGSGVDDEGERYGSRGLGHDRRIYEESQREFPNGLSSRDPADGVVGEVAAKNEDRAGVELPERLRNDH